MPDQFTLHHHEVQEMMGRMPNWIIRWANAGLLGGFLLVTLAASLVRFPDQVAATVRITQPLGAGGEAPHVRVTVPVGQVAAVHAGQPLLIALHAYPVQQYGYLRATVGRVLPLTDASVAEVQVLLPTRWRTTTGYAVGPQPLLTGVGSIVVSESSLLHRILRR